MQKINSKWIEDLNIRSETINYIEKDMGAKLMDLFLKRRVYEFDPKCEESNGKNK